MREILNNLKEVKILKILIETSARHAHLSEKDFHVLFGEHAKLTKKKELSQPGQFACEEKITLKGSKSDISNITILGPFRAQTQIEISLTDAKRLGLVVPIRDSGDLVGTPENTLIGPKGKVVLKNGLIVARRHIHLDPATATNFNLNHGQIVQVKIPSEKRALIFDSVRVCVDKNFLPAMHIDTDEANAAGLQVETYAEIIRPLSKKQTE